MKKNKWVAILIIILIIAGGITAFVLNSSKSKKLEYTTVSVEKGKVTMTVVTTGTLQAVTSVNVGAQVSGKIQKLYVDFNSPVKKGQILAEIDPSLLEAQVEESQASYDASLASLQNQQAQYQTSLMDVKTAQANLKTAQAKYEIAKSSVVSAEDAELSAKANLEKSKATLENKKLEYNRTEKLYKQNFISASDKDAAEMNYKVALADLDVASASVKQASSSVVSARLQLDSAAYDVEAAKIAEETKKSQVNSSLSQLKSAQAQSRQSKSKLDQAKVNLGYTIIYSPIDGIVTSRSVDEGQTVASSFNTPELFVIAQDLTNMEVLANVDEADIGKVKDDMDAEFTVDAYPTEKFKGKVKQVRSASTVESGVVTYQAVISADNKTLKLMPGMTANITIISQISDECIKIPNAALRFKAENVPDFPGPPKHTKRPPQDKDLSKMPPPEDSDKDRDRKDRKKRDGDLVWILKDDGTPRPAHVVTGISGGNFTEMKKGDLKEGDKVITAAAKAGKSKSKSKDGKNNGSNKGGPPGGGPMRV